MEVEENGQGVKWLTDSVINKLQNYYGMAIRSNVNDLQRMKSTVAAVLFHVAPTDAKPWPDQCPDGADIKKDISLGANECVHGKGLSLEIIKHVKPIFQDLQNDTPLSECLHGKNAEPK